jgi:hypothetical protein
MYICISFCKMKITDNILIKINRLPKGYVFTYVNFINEVKQKEAVIKALNRMAASGKITKLSKGRFYKPEATIFGKLTPEQSQVVKDLLRKDGKIIGYLTGLSMYNRLGLTTQVSNTIQIGKNQIRPEFKRGRYIIAFIKQKNTITAENIPILQILDAIRFINKIPDSSNNDSFRRIAAIIRKMRPENKVQLIRLSMKYPPATRALTGAILEYIGEKNTEQLKKSLNPITKYKLKAEVYPIAANWNII